MNSAVVAVGACLWLVVAYWLYGRFTERSLFCPDDDRPTPAHRLRDGVDYHPAHPAVLFGHHFSSIAGAGPIVGPVIAVAAFGYGATLLWILIGAVVIGAVHDYTTAMLSVRHDGQSIPDVTGRVLDDQARVLFQVFVWVALVFVVAVFAIAAKKTFMSDPRVVVPAFGLIPLAMAFGWLANRLRVSLPLCTVGSLAVLAALFWLGSRFPVALHTVSPELLASLGVEPLQLASFGAATAGQIWVLVLLLYATAAAVLPVWVLLQPRDYVGSWILAFGMGAGLLGLLIVQRPISAPLLAPASSATHHGPLWPMLFIVVACGAISGFHSLVSSGTTAKQLDRESHARPVVFGAMVVEGGLAVLAVLAVAAGLSWSAPGAGDAVGAATSAAAPAAGSLQAFMAAGEANPIGAFAAGFGVLTEPLLGGLGTLVGVTMINAFILTTLDTSVRLGRFITVELAGPRVGWLRNRFAATLLVVGCAYALAATGSVGTLWRMFGASNQLVAALGLLVVTAYLARRRPKGRWTLLVTLVPAVLMVATTVGALLWQGYHFLVAPEPRYGLACAALVLLALAALIGGKACRVVARAQTAGM